MSTIAMSNRDTMGDNYLAIGKALIAEDGRTVSVPDYLLKELGARALKDPTTMHLAQRHPRTNKCEIINILPRTQTEMLTNLGRNTHFANITNGDPHSRLPSVGEFTELGKAIQKDPAKRHILKYEGDTWRVRSVSLHFANVAGGVTILDVSVELNEVEQSMDDCLKAKLR